MSEVTNLELEKDKKKKQKKNETEFIFDDEFGVGFTVINNELMRDPRLSNAAVGLYSRVVMVRNIPGWKIYQSTLVTEKDGRQKIASAMKELIEAGYIEKIQLRNEKGHLDGVRYIIFQKSRNPYVPEIKVVEDSTEKDEKPDNKVIDINTKKEEKQKQTKKNKIKGIQEDSRIVEIMKHFNSKRDTNFWDTEATAVKNLNVLLETKSVEYIKEVIDFMYLKSVGQAPGWENTDLKKEKKYWLPTKFRYDLFITNANWYEAVKEETKNILQKKTADGPTTPPTNANKKYFIIFKGNINAVKEPKGTLNIDYFDTREDAEAFLNSTI